MKFSRFSGLAVAALIAIGLAGPAQSQDQTPPINEEGAAESTFTEAERDEIGRLVREYLLRNPEVLEEAIRELQERREQQRQAQAAEALRTERAALLQDETSPVGGNPDGDVTIVEFFDYQCGFCKRAFPHLQSVVREDGNIRVVYKEWPVLGPVSLYAARAALAARHQGKYEELHDALMSFEGRLTEEAVMDIAGSVGIDTDRLRADMEHPEIVAILQRNNRLAQTIGIEGTPAFIIGDALIPGAIGADEFRAFVERARENCRADVC